MDCYSCKVISGKKIISPGSLIYDSKYWIVDHAYPTQLPGWIVIILRRHAQALHELTKEEFLELAKLQEAITKLLYKEFNCEKEYIACFSEAKHFQHVHFHVIPKQKDLPIEFKGPKIFSMLKNEKVSSSIKNKIIEISEKLNEELNNS